MTQVLSQNVVKALTSIIQDEPKHIGVVEKSGELYFLILGSRKLYFVDKTLREQNSNDEAMNTIKYQNITKL